MDTKAASVAAESAESAEASDVELGDEQMYAFNTIVHRRKSVFITGKAGVGKSMLMRKVIQELQPLNVFVTASTGVAALQIGGTTLHTFLGLGLATDPIEKLVKLVRLRDKTRKRINVCDVLIVDEVSMLDPEFFTKCDVVMRVVRGCDSPFGGAQVVLCGDFFQLPPVVKKKNGEAVNWEFIFETDSWKEAIEETIVLSKIWRQQADPMFSAILNNMRCGCMNAEDIQTLKLCVERSLQQKDTNDLDIKPTIMYSCRRDVEDLNLRELALLKEPKHVMTASIWTAEKKERPREESARVRKDVLRNANKNAEKYLTTPLILPLKVGAQVMLTWNKDVSAGLVNGARGVVTEFVSELPVVKFTTGAEFTIEYNIFEINIPRHGTLYVRQIPLQLAWASTIHKSQGLSLTSAQISIDGSVFEYGQAYVAMSRVRTLAGVKLTAFSADVVRAHPKVIKFYASFDPEVEQISESSTCVLNNIFTLPERPSKKIKK
jgi:ATP-dependent DNA helicase PIF1